MNKVLFCLVFILTTTIAYSQAKRDVISFNDKLIFKANISTESETFSAIDDQERFTIEALNAFKLQLSANYKLIGLGITFSPNSRNGDFKSEFLQTNLQFFIKSHWIQEFQYRRVKGFYLENDNTQTLELQFPNLTSTNYSGSTSYLFNKNYSLNHLNHQNEWQTASSGSFIPTLKYGYNKITDEEISGEKIKQNNIDISLAPSYYYTWCYRENWFISPNITPEIGVRFSENKSIEDTSKETSITRALTLGLQFGYTDRVISTGAVFNFSSNNINKTINRGLINDRSFASVYFAYRFEAPNFLKHTVNSVEQFLGIKKLL